MSFLSHLHSELRGALKTRKGATHKPEEVPVGTHKTYERMEQIQLFSPEELSVSLSDALNARSSFEGGHEDGKISLSDWGTLFGLALKKRDGSIKRNYPSGGALYPIETYLISSAVPDSPLAAFHYNPSAHALAKLWNLPPGSNNKDMAPYAPNIMFSSIVIFTSVWKRSSAKYGQLAYLHALLEAGHMSENILLVATALKLKTRPMAGFDDALIMKILDLEENQQPIHTIVISI